MKRTRLRRKTPLRAGWPKRSTTARKRGYSESWNWCMERAGWRCEVVLDDTRCEDRATQAHHVKTRARGGSDDLSNLLAVCLAHHSWIHAHPEEATTRGYLAPSWEPESAA